MNGGIFGIFDIFEPDEVKQDGEQQSTVSTSESSSVVCSDLRSSVECSQNRNTLQNLRTKEHRTENPILRSPSFREKEDSLIEETVNGFDWDCNHERKTPAFVRLAYTLIAFPSLREMDCSAVAALVAGMTAAGDDLLETFEMKFERLQEKLPTFYNPEFVALVRAAVDSGELAVCDPSRKTATSTFTRSVNALYQWQELQGWDQDIGVPCRGLASVLSHEQPDHANLMLTRMVKLGFLRLVTKGSRGGKPSTYRFIGRVVDGVIVPRDPAAPYPI